MAIYLSNYLLAGPLEAPNIGVAETATIPNSARFPTLVAETKITAALFLAFVAVLIVWQLFRSPFGFSLRIIGGSRRVADYLGINVNRAILITFAISGALGGLGGASEILGNQYFLAENFSPGWGYTGIAVAVLGGSSAWGITLSAVFFGVIGAFAEDMQFTNGLSPDFALVVQAVAVIFVLLGMQLRNRMRERSRARGAGQGVSDAVPVTTTTESTA